MKLFIQILLSVLYPFLLIVLLLFLTGPTVGGQAAVFLATTLFLVMLPVFFYAVWNKAPIRTKLIQWGAGSVVACGLRLAVAITTDRFLLKAFDFSVITAIRMGSSLASIILSIWLARLLAAKLSDTAVDRL